MTKWNFGSSASRRKVCPSHALICHEAMFALCNYAFKLIDFVWNDMNMNGDKTVHKFRRKDNTVAVWWWMAMSRFPFCALFCNIKSNIIMTLGSLSFVVSGVIKSPYVRQALFCAFVFYWHKSSKRCCAMVGWRRKLVGSSMC